MKNADMPATAQSNNEIVKAFMEVEQASPNGLTKREAFAMAAMQGMSSHPEFYGQSGEFANNIASDCVKFADALLKELEK